MQDEKNEKYIIVVGNFKNHRRIHVIYMKPAAGFDIEKEQSRGEWNLAAHTYKNLEQAKSAYEYLLNSRRKSKKVDVIIRL